MAAGLCVCCLAASAWWFVEFRHRLRTEAIDHSLDLSSVLAGEIALVLQQPSDDLDLAADLLNHGGVAADLERFQRASRLVGQIVVLDREQRVTATVPDDPELRGLDWSRQPFAAGQRWSDTFIASDKGEPGVMISRAWDGGTVAFRLDLAQLSRLAGVITPPPGGFVAVLDHRGVVIGHGDPQVARRRDNMHDLAELLPLDGPTGLSRPVSWRGVSGLASRNPIPGTNWSIAVFQPSHHAFAAANETALLSAVVTGLALAAFITAAGLASRALGRAVRSFSQRMSLVAQGQSIQVSPEHAEFVPLARSFNAMAEAVRQRELALVRSQAEFRSLVEGVESVILRLDAQGRIIYLNPAGEHLFGWTTAELAGKDVREVLLPARDAAGKDLGAMVDGILAAPDRFRYNENENITRSGSLLWMGWSNRPVLGDDGRVVGMLAVGIDLTDRRRQDLAFTTLVEALSEVSGDALFDTATASIAGWLGCDLVIASRLVDDHLVALSFRSGANVERELVIAVKGTPRERVLAEGWVLIDAGVGHAFPDASDLTRIGAEAYAGVAIPGPGGAPPHRGVLSCIWRQALRPPPRLRAVLELVARRIGVELERADVIRALEESRAMLQGYLRHLPGPAAITGADGAILSDNGRELSVLALDGRPHPANLVEEEVTMPGHDGRARRFRIVRFPIPGGLTGHLASDETERHSLRERVSHTERLDALGKLAGGIAHDFNNQLAGIMGHADMLQRAAGDPKTLRHAEGVLAAAQRSAELTSQLLAFARKSVVDLVPVDLHRLVSDTVHLAERTMDRSIAIIQQLDAAEAVVQGSPGLLQSALLNLMLNARDAMPDGGLLRIATAIEPGRERRMLVLTVADSGQGMDEQVRQRLFEPFFTTKAPGKGNGLGLAAVYGTVTAMEGTIIVDSSPGRGATFTIRLPLIAATPAGPELEEPLRRGAGRVLLAEDETILRQATTEFLESLGYVVVPAVDGQEAVELVAAAPASFDLLILDLVMPRLGGRQALARIREVAPTLPVVVTTGYGDAGDLSALRAAGLPILAKPCTMARLVQAVQQAMAKRSAAR